MLYIIVIVVIKNHPIFADRVGKPCYKKTHKNASANHHHWLTYLASNKP